MKLEEIQSRAGLTNKELSQISGVSLSMIKLIKNGYKDYKRATIWKLANALGVEAKEIEEE